MKHPVVQQLSDFITEYSACSHIYLAYSGGLDSTVLLHALCETLPNRNLLTALHINHNLQSDSSAWVQVCESQCRALGVDLKVHCLNLASGSHEEERARNGRYAYFSETLKAGELLLMAHHLNDAVETLLFRLMRGGSSIGLAGIPERRSLGKGVLHRPFMKLKRAQLEEYASQNSLEWVQDPSNRNIQFDRNYIRARVLPVLLERWPGALERLADSIARLGEDSQIIVAWLNEHLDPVLVSRWKLDLGLLASYSRAQGPRLLRHWLERCGCFHTTKSQLDEIYRQSLGSDGAKLLFRLSGSQSAEIGFEYQLRRYRNHLLFCKVYLGELDVSYVWNVQPDLSPQILELPHGQLLIENNTQAIRPLALEVRFPIPGQKVHLVSAATPSGHHKSLADLFQQEGIPSWQRKQYPLVYCSQNLIAIPGVRKFLTGVEGEDPGIFTWHPKQPQS